MALWLAFIAVLRLHYTFFIYVLCLFLHRAYTDSGSPAPISAVAQISPQRSIAHYVS